METRHLPYRVSGPQGLLFYKWAHKAESQSGLQGSGTAKAHFPPLSGPRLGAWPQAEPDTHIHPVVNASAWEGKED